MSSFGLGLRFAAFHPAENAPLILVVSIGGAFLSSSLLLGAEIMGIRSNAQTLEMSRATVHFLLPLALVSLSLGTLALLGSAKARLRSRARRYATLRALGASARAVFSIALAESCLVVGLGALLAMLLSLIITGYFIRGLAEAPIPLHPRPGIDFLVGANLIAAALQLLFLLPSARAAARVALSEAID